MEIVGAINDRPYGYFFDTHTTGTVVPAVWGQGAYSLQTRLPSLPLMETA